MPKKNNPGCGCCGVSCLIVSDNFGRADNDNPGDYTEVSGDWDISSNALVTSSTSAVLISTTPNPSATPNIRVSVSVGFAATGRSARIILDYVDSSNYWFAELNRGTGANGYLKIYQRSGGSDTLKGSDNLDFDSSSSDMCASISGTTISATAGQRMVTVSGQSFSSEYWGLGTGTGTSVLTFTSLRADQTDGDCPPCPQKDCDLCTAVYGPAQLKVVIPSGTMEFAVQGVDGGDDRCASTDCASAEGTYYLSPTRCVHLSVDSGKCVNPVHCAYWARVCLPCDSNSTFNVLEGIAAFLVYPSLSVHLVASSWTAEGFALCDNSWNFIRTSYRKTYGAQQDCSAWVAESVPWLSHTDSDTGHKHCRGKTTSSVEVTAIG